MTSVVVVGSGVVGASIAYHLAVRGIAVTLVDAARPASPPSASWASAGGLRSQGRHPAEHPITVAAARRWSHLASELDADLGCVLGGHLHVAENEDELEPLDARIASDRRGGIAVERLQGRAVFDVAPSLAPHVLAAAWTPQDGQADAALTTRAFAAAAARAGARLLFGQAARLDPEPGKAIDGVSLADGTRLAADRVVLAIGAWSAALPGAGLDVALDWTGLQILLSDPLPALLGPTVTATGRNLSLKQVPAGALMVGGRWTARPAGPAPGVAPDGATTGPQWQAAAGLLPCLAALPMRRCWAGAEARTPDGLPVIGRLTRTGLYVAAGFGGHGFQIAPTVGELVAADLFDEPHPLLAPFRPDRPGLRPAHDAEA